jgi:SAM-dependent methyltransferase
MNHYHHDPGHDMTQLGPENAVATGAAHAAPGSADALTPRMLHGRGRTHDLMAMVFFGGRRHRIFARLVAESGARRGDRVLDVGCGTGHFTRAMAEAVAPSGTALGVDPSIEAIAEARRRTRRANCTFSDGIAQALDAPEGSFDVVVSSLMIHHLPEMLRPQAIGEMFRVLRSGGSLLVAEFRPPSSRIGRRLVRTLTGHGAMAENRVDLLAPMIQEVGFEQIRTGDLRPWTYFIQAQKPSRVSAKLPLEYERGTA